MRYSTCDHGSTEVARVTALSMVITILPASATALISRAVCWTSRLSLKLDETHDGTSLATVLLPRLGLHLPYCGFEVS